MALIATVNGKAIYSDKSMSGINNSRVMFADGSWCDVHTGEVHNTGSGYINIGGSDGEGSGEKITKGPESVTASSLIFNDLSADVSVEVHDGENIQYTVVGPENVIEKIYTKVVAGVLEIWGEESSSGRSQNFMSIGGISIGGGVTMISSGSSSSIIVGGRGRTQSDTKITIKVPARTNVTVLRINGLVTIGDTDGNLNVEVRSGDVRAGRVRRASLGLQGSGDITVKEVNGNVTAHVQDSGDIRVKDGAIESLNATLQGSGDIEIGGVAQTATLVLQGSGDIRVKRVMTHPRKTVQGSGDIRVKHIG